MSGGNPALQPQKSTQSDLGSWWRPRRVAGFARPLEDLYRQQHRPSQLERDHQPSRSVRRYERAARPGRPRLSEPARTDGPDREPNPELGRLARQRRRRVGVDPSRRDGRRADLGTPGRDLRAVRAPEHLRQQHGGPGGCLRAALAARDGGQPGPGTLARRSCTATARDIPTSTCCPTAPGGRWLPTSSGTPRRHSPSPRT